MKVELISYSQPAEYFAENTTELVAFCARVSNPGNQSNKEQDLNEEQPSSEFTFYGNHRRSGGFSLH